MKILYLSMIAAVVVAAIFAGSFLYSTQGGTQTLPYARLTISRLDNFMLPGGQGTVVFQSMGNTSSSVAGETLVQNAVNAVNAVYGNSENRCQAEGALKNGYCNGIPIYAVYNQNLTEQDYGDLTLRLSLQKVSNSSNDLSAYIDEKRPGCLPFMYGRAFVDTPRSDGTCYYHIMIVKK